ncbi:MAG: metallophosphoesterase [Spirochaetota bacterium]
MTADQLSERNLVDLYERTPKQTLNPEDRYVIVSDLHMGNGGRTDDFKRNASLFALAMQDYYLSRGYKLILNGDVEELQRFRLEAIQRKWSRIYDIFSRFAAETELIRLVGNHDLELFWDPPKDFDVLEALRFDYHDDDIFVFHGHQSNPRLLRYSTLIRLVLRYIATPLRIHHYEVSHDSEKKFRTERRVYSFAGARKLLSVIGHTHRPLFESMSKVDSIKFEIERLVREYPAAEAREKREIETSIDTLKRELVRIQQEESDDNQRESLYNDNLVVPSLFNSGCVIGKRGMTVLELDGSGRITLAYWFDRRRSQKYLQYETYETTQLGDSDYYRVEIQTDSLDYVLSRVKLLA